MSAHKRSAPKPSNHKGRPVLANSKNTRLINWLINQQLLEIRELQEGDRKISSERERETVFGVETWNSALKLLCHYLKLCWFSGYIYRVFCVAATVIVAGISHLYLKLSTSLDHINYSSSSSSIQYFYWITIVSFKKIITAAPKR